ncbi:MAG TPA: L-threonylcarbamoyladenylate synthase [Nitrospiraceae bacterium]|nr:L-threonylcarbamoyladenylate synthase [Nitrospiraceae bacterium]
MAAIELYSASDLPRLAQSVKRIVHDGGIVALPTETYYGLAVDPFNEVAVDRLLRLKGREDGKPILVLIGQRAQLPLLVRGISPLAEFLIDRFWPGPLTILFEAQPSLPSNLTAGTGTVGVRLSSCGPLIDLLAITGPLTGTSANRAGGPPAQEATYVRRALGPDVDLIIDAGPTPGGPPSTVVDARGAVRLIREGAVTRQMLQNVLQTRGISLT